MKNYLATKKEVVLTTRKILTSNMKDAEWIAEQHIREPWTSSTPRVIDVSYEVSEIIQREIMPPADFYSFYLFSKLYDLYFTSLEEYDTCFDRELKLYYEFIASDYNKETEPEYECIEQFLQNLKYQE